MANKPQPKFETVQVRRLGADGKPDGTTHEMSRKVFENVHKGGQFFELAEQKKEKKGDA